jgi:hypothetical protein
LESAIPKATSRFPSLTARDVPQALLPNSRKPLKQEEAKMTFHFNVWPFSNPISGTTKKSRLGRFAPARPRQHLVAHWRRGKDGHLELHWEAVPD